MRKLMKMMALLLTLVMCLAMSGLAAFAADNTNTVVTEATNKYEGEFSITLTGAEEGHTFTAYKIFDGSVSTDGKLADISWAADVNVVDIATALADAGLPTTIDGKTLNLSVAADVAEALATYADDADVVQKVADVFYARKGAAAGSTSEMTEGNYVITPLVAGYYLVTDVYTSDPGEGAATLSRNILAVAGDVTAEVKNDKPEIDKKILDPAPVDANAAGIGDHVFYQITGTVPNYTGYVNYFYVINDKLSEGLTFDGKQNLVVKVGDETLVEDEDYVVYLNEDGYTFQVGFTNIKAYDIGEEITVTYSATVNEDAVIGGTGNPNETDLTYSNNPNNSSGGDPADEPKPDDDIPTGVTPKEKTITYVAELDLTKYFDEVKDGNELSGAEFTLTGLSRTIVAKGVESYKEDADGTFYKLTNGTYTTTAPHADILNSDGSVAVFSNESNYESTTTKYSLQNTTEVEVIEKEVFMQGMSGSDGKIIFKGLGPGTYTLKETVTPIGYNTAEDIVFTIEVTVPTEITTGEETAEFAVVNVSPAGAVTLKDGVASTGIYETDVVDKSGSVLPSTGGRGTTMLYLVGAVLVIGAGILLVTRRRMSTK